MGIFHSKSLDPERMADLLENTQFNKQQLEERYKEFQKKYRSGRLGQAEFFKEYGPRLQNSQELAAHYFNIFDKDKNGTIDFKELMCAESIRLHDNLQFAFDLYDTDQDGSITREEMLRITRIMYKSMGDKKMVRLPKDEETPEQLVNKIFGDIDLNKDNKLSYDEFVRYMSQSSVGRP